jgi:inorganic triphosphatase YgiF
MHRKAHMHHRAKVAGLRHMHQHHLSKAAQAYRLFGA